MASASAPPIRLKGGGTHLGYQTHYFVDGGKARISVGVLVTPGEVSESQPMRDLLWRVRFRWKLRPQQVTGDTKYGTTENIRAVEDMGMRAYVPLPDWERNSPYFGTSRFQYDAEHAPVAGGVLVLHKGQVIGAVGMSGDGSDNDEACAIAGVQEAGLEAEVGEAALGKQ